MRLGAGPRPTGHLALGIGGDGAEHRQGAAGVGAHTIGIGRVDRDAGTLTIRVVAVVDPGSAGVGNRGQLVQGTARVTPGIADRKDLGTRDLGFAGLAAHVPRVLPAQSALDQAARAVA